MKDLSEENFLDLIAGKNQDQRFYGWLHFKPLFDGSDKSNSSDGYEIDDIDPQNKMKMSESIKGE